MSAADTSKKQPTKSSFKKIIFKILLIVFVATALYIIYNQDKLIRHGFDQSASSYKLQNNNLEQKISSLEKNIASLLTKYQSLENSQQVQIQPSIQNNFNLQFNTLFEELYVLIDGIRFSLPTITSDNGYKSKYSNEYLATADEYLHKVFSVKPVNNNLDSKITFDLQKNELKFLILKTQIYLNLNDFDNYTTSKNQIYSFLTDKSFDREHIDAIQYILGRINPQ